MAVDLGESPDYRTRLIEGSKNPRLLYGGDFWWGFGCDFGLSLGLGLGFGFGQLWIVSESPKLFYETFFLEGAQSRGRKVDLEFLAVNDEGFLLDIGLENFAGLAL